MLKKCVRDSFRGVTAVVVALCLLLWSLVLAAGEVRPGGSIWMGEMQIGQTTIPLKLWLRMHPEPTGKAWVAHSSSGIPLEDLSWKENEVSFSIPAKPAPFKIHARISESRMTGTVSFLPGAEGTLDLTRKDNALGGGEKAPH